MTKVLEKKSGVTVMTSVRVRVSMLGKNVQNPLVVVTRSPGLRNQSQWKRGMALAFWDVTDVTSRFLSILCWMSYRSPRHARLDLFWRMIYED
jgi:hypothetical protein